MIKRAIRALRAATRVEMTEAMMLEGDLDLAPVE